MATAVAVSSSSTPRSVIVGATIWVALAVAFTALGGFRLLPFPVPQLMILALFGVALFAAGTWLNSLPWKLLVGAHAIRLVGVVFLILGARGTLAPAFASRAGWGDITTALVAIALVAFAIAPDRARWLHNLWNVLGLTDLIIAVGTATAVTLQGHVPGMGPLFSLPLSLVPLFFVPVLAASHVVMLRRINASRAR